MITRPVRSVWCVCHVFVCCGWIARIVVVVVCCAMLVGVLCACLWVLFLFVVLSLEKPCCVYIQNPCVPSKRSRVCRQEARVSLSVSLSFLIGLSLPPLVSLSPHMSLSFCSSLSSSHFLSLVGALSLFLTTMTMSTRPAVHTALTYPESQSAWALARSLVGERLPFCGKRCPTIPVQASRRLARSACACAGGKRDVT